LGAVGVTTATGLLLGAGAAGCELPLELEEPVSLDGTEPDGVDATEGPLADPLPVVAAELLVVEAELLVSAAACTCAPDASGAAVDAGAALAAVAVGAAVSAGVAATSTVPPVPPPPPPPPPWASVRTGALNSTAQVRVSTAPLDVRPRIDWNCRTAPRVSGP
jgi:hypothetical protein